jgi:hypothetical protein
MRICRYVDPVKIRVQIGRRRTARYFVRLYRCCRLGKGRTAQSRLGLRKKSRLLGRLSSRPSVFSVHEYRIA